MAGPGHSAWFDLPELQLMASDPRTGAAAFLKALAFECVCL